MAIKAGQILHAMNQFVVDRIQTGGAGNLNIPQERIYELGNYQSVGIVRDVPDLTFTLDVLDVSTQVEALLAGSADPEADTLGDDGLTGTNYPLSSAGVVDIISPFKSTQGAYDIVKGVAVPQLSLEQAQYRYGLRQNAGENFTLRGDSIYYVPGVPYLTTYTGDGATTAYSFQIGGATPVPLTALPYTEQGDTLYALNVSVNGVRQNLGTDYTETNTGITFAVAPANGAKIRIVFGSVTATTTYPQSVHNGLTVKPAAIRGKDIQVYVGTTGATPDAPFHWSDVQSVNIDWRITLEADYEFGNPHAVARDFLDAPVVSGTIELKPITVNALFAKLNQMTGVPSNEVVGPQSSVTLPLQVRLLNPESGGTSAVPAGTVLKTLHIPDARFTIPGYEGRVNQKLVNQLAFESDRGVLNVFKGLPYDIGPGGAFA